jgi:hypothetical protein
MLWRNCRVTFQSMSRGTEIMRWLWLSPAQRLRLRVAARRLRSNRSAIVRLHCASSRRSLPQQDRTFRKQALQQVRAAIASGTNLEAETAKGSGTDYESGTAPNQRSMRVVCSVVNVYHDDSSLVESPSKRLRERYGRFIGESKRSGEPSACG